MTATPARPATDRRLMRLSAPLRTLVANYAAGPVEWCHAQFFRFPVDGGRMVTVFHNDGRFEHAYTGRGSDFHAQHQTIKALRRVIPRPRLLDLLPAAEVFEHGPSWGGNAVANSEALRAAVRARKEAQR